MKYIIILGDGMADEPIASLNNKTCLQAANKPNIDKVAAMGRSGLLDTIPAGFAPGSEIANMSVLGYDVPKVFEGRGSLEAASMGVAIADGEMAMRCNLICIEDEKIKNHSAGHISNEEAEELILFLQKELGNEHVNFFPGVSYRHLLKIKGGKKQLKCTPPHDVPGTPYADVMIKAKSDDANETADLLNDLILKSQALLENHPVNIKRAAAGKDKANSIWPWSPGYKPDMKTLLELYNLKSGSVISAVDLIRGIGVYAGLKIIEVEGITGLWNTNYEGKAQAAIEALRTDDFVYLHIEASDEAGHEGDVDLKIKTIEYLDSRVVKPILEEVSTWTEPVTIAILPDHPTPCAIKTHTNKPVPFIIYRTGETPDEVQVYDEFAVDKGSYGLLRGMEFMQTLIKPLSPNGE
jgi:2,3-bisphosphoglycerate-independent phosphoglycerate mutase